MKLHIGIIRGDGIGPEIVAEAVKVLEIIGTVFGHELQYEELLLGGASIDACGIPLTEEAVQCAKQCDALLMGTVKTSGSRTSWNSKSFESFCKSQTSCAL
mgnify:CR=1 FL=1